MMKVVYSCCSNVDTTCASTALFKLHENVLCEGMTEVLIYKTIHINKPLLCKYVTVATDMDIVTHSFHARRYVNSYR